MTAPSREYQRRMWVQRHETEVRRIGLALTTLAMRRFFDHAGAAPAGEVMARLRELPTVRP
jgi:hypothetical protein